MHILWLFLILQSFLFSSDKEILRIVFPQHFPPHYMYEEGQTKGFALDILDYLANDLNLTTQHHVLKTWSQVWGEVEKNNFDIIPDLGITPERKKHVDFSEPYSIAHLVLFGRKGSGLKTIEQFEDKVVGVVNISAAKLLFKERYPTIKLRYYETKEEAFVDFLSGKIDGFAYLELPILSMAQSFEVEDRIYIVKILEEIPRAVALRKGQEELLTRINLSLDKLKKSEHYQKIYKKWYSIPELKKYTQKQMNILLLSVVGVVLFLCGILAWIIQNTRRLKKALEQQKISQQALEENERMLRHFFEKNASVMLIIDPSTGTIINANSAASEFYGYALTTLRGLHIGTINQLNPQELFPKMQEALQGHINHIELVHRLASGEGRNVDIYVSPYIFDHKKVLFAIVHDITQRHRDEEQLKLAANVFFYAQEGMVITDENNCIIDINAAFTRINGYTKEEALGKNPNILKSDKHPLSFYEDLWKTLLEKDVWQGEIWNKHKNGTVYPEFLTIAVVRNEAKEIKHYLGIFHDISKQKAYEEKMEQLAYHDTLTGLPNRLFLIDRLYQEITKVHRYPGKKFSLIYLDLDGFKGINDTYGHEMGDKILKTVAKKMQKIVRQFDTISRFGGDEFIILLSEYTNEEESLQTLKRLLKELQGSYTIDGTVLTLSASAGITFYPQNQYRFPEELIKQADEAMYKAKLGGKNQYQIFTY